MKSQQILGVCLRLFAIWLVIKSIQYLTILPYNSYQENGTEQIFVSFIIGLAHLIGAFVIWLFPMSISSIITPYIENEKNNEIQLNQIAMLGISLIGLWIIADVIPALISYFYQMYLNSGDVPMFSILNEREKADILFMVLELVIGLTLFFYSKAIGGSIIKRNN